MLPNKAEVHGCNIVSSRARGTAARRRMLQLQDPLSRNLAGMMPVQQERMGILNRKRACGSALNADDCDTRQPIRRIAADTHGIAGK
jgi:hypothetical protein